jgi:hypothetical protein
MGTFWVQAVLASAAGGTGKELQDLTRESGSCQWMASGLLARKTQPRVQVLMTASCVVLVSVVSQ